MSILIKGMEMPKHCWQCKFHDDVDECIIIGENCVEVWGEYKRLENCPLIHVPPHGRLIDADALRRKQQEDADLFIGSRIDVERRDEALNAVANIVNAPTIIPAEEDMA